MVEASARYETMARFSVEEASRPVRSRRRRIARAVLVLSLFLFFIASVLESLSTTWLSIRRPPSTSSLSSSLLSKRLRKGGGVSGAVAVEEEAACNASSTTRVFFASAFSFNPSRRWCAQRPSDVDDPHAVPAFVVMVVNRGDWLTRLVHSLDVPVRKLVVVHNVLPHGPDASDVVDAIATLVNEYGTRFVRVFTSHGNMGVSGSLNLVFKTFPEDEYWMVADADFAFHGPGEMAKVVAALHPSWSRATTTIPTPPPPPPDVVFAPQFRNWALRRDLVRKIGLFDENFWPAYVEDCDYHLRALLHDNVTIVEMHVAHWHGDVEVIAPSDEHAHEHAAAVAAGEGGLRRRSGTFEDRGGNKETAVGGTLGGAVAEVWRNYVYPHVASSIRILGGASLVPVAHDLVKRNRLTSQNNRAYFRHKWCMPEGQGEERGVFECPPKPENVGCSSNPYGDDTMTPWEWRFDRGARDVSMGVWDLTRPVGMLSKKFGKPRVTSWRVKLPWGSGEVVDTKANDDDDDNDEDWGKRKRKRKRKRKTTGVPWNGLKPW